jgi:allantoinase
MAARVAAAYLRGDAVWDGAAVLNKPGHGNFVPRQGA